MSQGLIRRVLMKIAKNYLPYEYIERLKLFEEIEVLKGVTITRLPSTKGIYLISKMESNVDIVEHYHNSEEYLYINKGKIVINNTVELIEGDEYQFKPFETHKIKVIEDCEMYIQLIKDEDFKYIRK